VLSVPSCTMARMIRGVLPRGLRPLLAAGLAAVLLLSGCSDDGDNPGESEENGESGTPATEETPYLEGVPEGIELTAQGSELAVGESATVAYEPRQDQVGALDITVTELVDADYKQFVGWRITPETRQKSPYFVHATVTNVGDTDLGGTPVPLYAVDGDNKLIEASTFQSAFKPCPQGAFPRKFRNGDTGKFCMVYLAPDRGDLTAVSFRPTEDFNPIAWTGDLVKPEPPKKKKKKGGGQGGGGGGGGNGGGGGGQG